jgi:hypothetical protein
LTSRSRARWTRASTWAGPPCWTPWPTDLATKARAAGTELADAPGRTSDPAAGASPRPTRRQRPAAVECHRPADRGHRPLRNTSSTPKNPARSSSGRRVPSAPSPGPRAWTTPCPARRPRPQIKALVQVRQRQRGPAGRAALPAWPP